MRWDQKEFNKWYKSWLKNFNKRMEKYFGKIVRARTNKGQYKGDDKSTPNVNEAYTKKKA
tara:strand:+ start:277 stop:456 length:180 start_codon:yes stop_codon:yes gene_type:complete